MANLIVDAHLDLAYSAVVLGRDLTRPVSEIRARERQAALADATAGTCTVSVPALLEGRVGIVGGSLFVEPARKSRPTPLPVYHSPQEAHQQALVQMDYYLRLADEHDNIRLLLNESDLDAVLASWDGEHPELGIYVVMEGAEPILEPDQAAWWAERGVRGIGLTWSAGTRYAGGNGAPAKLSDEGIALLARMADLNLTLDLSHLWPEAALEAIERYPGPVIASHANPRAFVDNPRMLSDDLIRLVADRDGVIGAVACNPMLDADWRSGDQRVPLARLVEAIDHVCQVSGQVRCAGIGSDMDGGFGAEASPAELDTSADLVKIEDLLKQRGYAQADITAIMGGNWLRILRGTLRAFS